MAKASAQTGTQKKTARAENKSARMANKEYQKGLKGSRRLADTSKQKLQDIQAGKGEYASDIASISRRMEEAGQGAERFYGDIEQRALRNYQQNISPGLANREAGRGSSSIAQAVAAARGNLAQDLAGQFAQVKQQLAGNVLNASQAAQQQQFNAAQLGLSQAPSPVQTGLAAANPYRAGKQGPNSWQQLAGTVLEGGLTVAGSMLGPGGAFAGNAAGKGLKGAVAPTQYNASHGTAYQAGGT